MGIAENRRNRVLGVAQAQLESGEQVAAVLPQAQTGPTPWFALLTYLIFFWIRMWAMVVTDRRVLFVKCSTWTGPGVWGKLVLDEAGTPLKLNVHRIHRDDADGLVQALGGAAAAA